MPAQGKRVKPLLQLKLQKHEGKRAAMRPLQYANRDCKMHDRKLLKSRLRRVHPGGTTIGPLEFKSILMLRLHWARPSGATIGRLNPAR